MNISSSMLNYVWGYDIDFDIPKDPYKYGKWAIGCVGNHIIII